MNFDKLQAFIHQHKDTPFEWGTHDCCLFAANALLHATGVDYAAKMRGKYKTERGAIKALAKYGKRTIKATLTDIFGEPVAPLLARRGDIVLVDIEGTQAVGIKMTGVVVLQQSGLSQLNDEFIVCCWRAY